MPPVKRSFLHFTGGVIDDTYMCVCVCVYITCVYILTRIFFYQRKDLGRTLAKDRILARIAALRVFWLYPPAHDLGPPFHNSPVAQLLRKPYNGR